MYTDDQSFNNHLALHRAGIPYAGKIFVPVILSLFFLITACSTRTVAEQEFIPPPSRTPIVASDSTPSATPVRMQAVIQPTTVQVQSRTETIDLNCTYSPYYWQNRPDIWLTENIIIGRLTYTKRDVLAVFAVETQDVITNLLKQFFAAALNILKGADPREVEVDISEASNWLDVHPIGVSLSPDEMEKGTQLLSRLEAYNRGEIGPGPCPDEPILPTTTPQPSPTSSPTPTPTSRFFFPVRTRTATSAPRATSAPPGHTAVAPTNTPAPTSTSQPTQPPTQPPPTNTRPPTQPPPTATNRPLPTIPPEPTSTDVPPATPTSPPPPGMPAPVANFYSLPSTQGFNSLREILYSSFLNLFFSYL